MGPNDVAKREAFIEKVASERIPLLHDGIKLYGAFHKYTTEVVDILYADEAAVKADAAINAYWTGLENSRLHQGRTAEEYAFGLGAISKERLASQLAHMMFYVTGYHKLIGSLGDYMEGG